MSFFNVICCISSSPVSDTKFPITALLPKSTLPTPIIVTLPIKENEGRNDELDLFRQQVLKF